MPYVVSGNVKLFFEESGSGYPIIFLHEFDSIPAAGNAQLEAFFSAVEWGSGRRVSRRLYYFRENSIIASSVCNFIYFGAHMLAAHPMKRVR